MTKTATVHAQQRWEYMSISRKTDTYLAQELNTLGQDGWELVTVSYARGKKEEMFWTAFLKRPAVGHAAPATARESTAAGHEQAPAAASSHTPEGFDLDGEVFAIHEEAEKKEREKQE